MIANDENKLLSQIFLATVKTTRTPWAELVKKTAEGISKLQRKISNNWSMMNFIHGGSDIRICRNSRGNKWDGRVSHVTA